MLIISGLGNGKEIINSNIKTHVASSMLDYEHLKKKQPTNELHLLIYDGLYIEKYLKDSIYFMNTHHIPIFFDGFNIHIFGEMKNSNYEDFSCPRCIIKQVREQYLTLNLYATLFKRTDFYAFNYSCFNEEMHHFSSLLLEIISNKKITNRYLRYSLLNNLFFSEEFNGLSRCEACDKNTYSQDELFNYIKGL
ncbi:hypothetical protein ACEUWW_12115 [Staphylococcus pseudintermedius]